VGTQASGFGRSYLPERVAPCSALDSMEEQMKTLLLAMCIIAAPAVALGDFVCSEVACSEQPYCGNASLPADGQHCKNPKPATYCSWTTCRYGAKFQSWTWTVQPKSTKRR